MVYVPKLPDKPTQPEIALIDACALGEKCRLGDGKLPSEDAGADRIIRAEVIRFLALGGDDERPVDPSGVNLAGACVLGDIDLDGASISIDVILDFCDISGVVKLSNAKLQTLSLVGSAVCGVQGDSSMISGHLLMSNGFTSHGAVNFNTASIRGKAEFWGGSFLCDEQNYGLELEGVVIGGSIMFSGSINDKSSIIRKDSTILSLNLAGAQANSLVDSPYCWPAPGLLILDGFQYNHIQGDWVKCDFKSRLDWLNRQPESHLTSKFKPHPYEQLAKVLKQMGHLADAREISIAKQDRLYAMASTPKWSRVWGWLLKMTIAYGYKPWKVFIPAGIMVLLGMCVFGFAWETGFISPAKERVYLDQSGAWQECQTKRFKARDLCMKKQLPDYPQFKALTYSLDVFLPIVNLHQEEFWLPNAERGVGGFARWFMWLQIVAGWILTSLGVAGLTGVVKKD